MPNAWWHFTAGDGDSIARPTRVSTQRQNGADEYCRTFRRLPNLKTKNDEQTARNGRLEDKCRIQLSCAPPVAHGRRPGGGGAAGHSFMFAVVRHVDFWFDNIYIFAASRPSTKLKVQLHARAMLLASEREKCKDSALSICLNAVVIHTRSCQRFINVEIRRLTRWKWTEAEGGRAKENEHEIRVAWCEGANEAIRMIVLAH